jgi:hypothetical protein
MKTIYSIIENKFVIAIILVIDSILFLLPILLSLLLNPFLGIFYSFYFVSYILIAFISIGYGSLFVLFVITNFILISKSNIRVFQKGIVISTLIIICLTTFLFIGSGYTSSLKVKKNYSYWFISPRGISAIWEDMKNTSNPSNFEGCWYVVNGWTADNTLYYQDSCVNLIDYYYFQPGKTKVPIITDKKPKKLEQTKCDDKKVSDYVEYEEDNNSVYSSFSPDCKYLVVLKDRDMIVVKTSK